MEETRKVIAEMIENESYFKEAHAWYNWKFLSPYSHRLYMLIICLTICVFAGLIVQVIFLATSKQEYPFPIYVDDQINFFSKMIPLSDKVEPIPTSMAKYFAKEYIETRESYNYDYLNTEEWRGLLLKIRAMSSRKIYGQYMDYLDSSKNADSPEVRYKRHTRRLINVDSVVIPPKQESAPSSAIVYFTAIEQGRREYVTSKWIANLEFTMTNLDKLIEDKYPLQFAVTKYEVVEQSNLKK